MAREEGKPDGWRFPDWAVPWQAVMAGFLVLAAPPIVLFAFGVWGTLRPGGTAPVSPALIGGGLAIGLGIRYEWWEVRRVIKAGSATIQQSYANPIAVVGGAVITYAGVVGLGLSPIVSAGVVGILAALLVRSVAVPAYCGAFVGMTSPVLFGSFEFTVLAALLAGLVFVLAHPVYHGVGGKLGTTAFVGVVGIVLATGTGFLSGAIPDPTVVLSAIGLAALGAMSTFAIHTRAPYSPVIASGLVGTAGGTLLPAVAGASGGLLAGAVFAASFAGMSDPKRIPDVRWIGVTGMGVGLAVVYTTPFLGGSGGKLGTIAFGACLGVHGVLRRVDAFRLRRRRYRAPERETT